MKTTFSKMIALAVATLAVASFQQKAFAQEGALAAKAITRALEALPIAEKAVVAQEIKAIVAAKFNISKSVTTENLLATLNESQASQVLANLKSAKATSAIFARPELKIITTKSDKMIDAATTTTKTTAPAYSTSTSITASKIPAIEYETITAFKNSKDFTLENTDATGAEVNSLLKKEVNIYKLTSHRVINGKTCTAAKGLDSKALKNAVKYITVYENAAKISSTLPAGEARTNCYINVAVTNGLNFIKNELNYASFDEALNVANKLQGTCEIGDPAVVAAMSLRTGFQPDQTSCAN